MVETQAELILLIISVVTDLQYHSNNTEHYDVIICSQGNSILDALRRLPKLRFQVI
jgi:hypothetical protein